MKREDRSPDPGDRSPLPLPPLSLYLHIPWCIRKCPYCDFNSYPRGDLPENDYIDALIVDLESALPFIQERPVISLFFGGGTPSLLSVEGLGTLLRALRTRLTFAPDAEITLEANPGATETGKFEAFRAAGINRLSLGVQSFNDASLAALGRIHDAREAQQAARTLARHFDHFNLDLMYGLPGQSLREALADVEQALALDPGHLSCYQLAMEPGTAFAASPPALPDPDLCADMQEAIESRLGEAGFTHYETSAFARPGHACLHNLNYWTFGDYLGIGAGAHSKLTRHDGTWEVIRQVRWSQPRQYREQVMAGRPLQETFRVGVDDLPFEFMMNALRLVAGFEAGLFEARTALSLATVETLLRRAEREGLLIREAGRIAPSQRGQRFLNRLLTMFLPSRAAGCRPDVQCQ